MVLSRRSSTRNSLKIRQSTSLKSPIEKVKQIIAKKQSSKINIFINTSGQVQAKGNYDGKITQEGKELVQGLVETF